VEFDALLEILEYLENYIEDFLKAPVSRFENFWYDCDFGDVRKAGGCDMTNKVVPECNFVLADCNVGFCDEKIDTEAEERACSAEGWCKLGFDMKPSAVLNDATRVIECNSVTGHQLVGQMTKESMAIRGRGGRRGTSAHPHLMN
jgi:hypothetical protein